MRKTLAKKGLLLPLMGALLLLLSGCRKEMEAANLYLGLPGAEVAVFTGVLEDGIGEGTLAFADWSYTGSFRVQSEDAEAALFSGTAENYPWTLIFSGEAAHGRYTGALENAVPVGVGVFTADGGFVYTGEVFGEAAVSGEVEDLLLTVSHQGSRYTGVFSGRVENGLAEDETVWEATNAAGQRLRWEGGIASGELAGEGKLSCDRLMTVVEGRERMGSYLGAAVDGVPEGQGLFTSVDAQGVEWTYLGSWKGGCMDGQGELRYAANDRYIRAGAFTAGSFTPTGVEALSVLGSAEPVFALTDAQREFLSAHPELWEAESRTNFNNSEYRGDVDRGLSLWTCFNEPETMETPRWMQIYSLKVLNAYSGPAFPGGPAMTRITAAERNYDKVLYIIVPGTVEGIASNQWVSFIGLPIALSGYTTVLGTWHSCLVVVAGDLAITG